MGSGLQVRRRVGNHLVTLLLAGALVGGTGCSAVRKAAMGHVGGALARGGTTFASDDDPEFIRLASPFSLKMMEALLAENPEDEGLLLAACKGFTQYAYAFLLDDADRLADEDFLASEELRTRAAAMFLRGRDYGLRGLEAAYSGFAQELDQRPREAVRQMQKGDVPLLYWTACAWGGAISAARNEPKLIAGLPQVEALIDRAFALDPGYDHGAIHQFLITFEGTRVDRDGDPHERSRVHMERAAELSGGGLAAPFVSFAETVSVQQQDRKEFEALLHRALAIDPDERPEWRLNNLIMQRRARRLLAAADDLFLTREPMTAEDDIK